MSMPDGASYRIAASGSVAIQTIPIVFDQPERTSVSPYLPQRIRYPANRSKQMENSHLILLSGSDIQETVAGELVHSRLGGQFVRVDAQRKTPGLSESDVVRLHPNQLEQLYYQLPASRSVCTVVVSANAVPATLEFLEQHQGTVSDFASVICTTTPCAASQQSVADRLPRVSRMGVDQSQLGVFFTQAPRTGTVEEAYGQLVAFIRDNFPRISLEAVLQHSSIFTRIRDLQLPVATALRGEVDYKAALEQAHKNCEPEDVLNQLARQLMVQRALSGCKAEISRALNTLRIPDLFQRNRPPPVLTEGGVFLPQAPVATDEIMSGQTTGS
jgi:hypothetical protein